MAWEMGSGSDMGSLGCLDFFWQTLLEISFIFGCPLPSRNIIFHSPITFSGFLVSLVFCLWKERCRDWTLQPEIPDSLSSISAGLSQTLQFRVSMTDLMVQFTDVLQIILFEALYLAICIFVCIAKGTERKGKVLIFWEARQWLLFRGRCTNTREMLLRPLRRIRPIDASSFFNHFWMNEKVLPWIIRTDFPTILLWTTNAKHSTNHKHLRLSKGSKPESQGSRNHIFHVEQSNPTSDLEMVQTCGVLLASPPPASWGDAVQTAHSLVSGIAVMLDHVQV